MKKTVIGTVVIISIFIGIGLFSGYLQIILLVYKDKIQEKYYCRDIEFNSKEWLENKIEFYKCPIRSKMTNDLIINKKLINMDYVQMVKLLGEPDFERNDLVIYWIGTENIFHTKESIQINLNKLGKVILVERRVK